jgi:hypothetical protein
VGEDPPAGERARTIAQYQAALADAQEGVRRARAALATVGELQDSLESMPVIEQAKGIVMAQQRCGPEEAFDLLRRASQRKKVKVSVLAARMVEQIASSATGDSAMPAQPTVNGTVTGRSPGAQP